MLLQDNRVKTQGEDDRSLRCSLGQGGQDTWGKMTAPQDDRLGQEGQDTWVKMPGPQDASQ